MRYTVAVARRHAGRVLPCGVVLPRAGRGAEGAPPALGGHTNVVSRIAITADGKLLATASHETVKLWDLATGKEIANFTGHGDAAFTPDGQTLATGGYEGPLKLWNLTTHNEIAAIEFDYHVRRLAFTPDGKTLITAGEGPIKLFDAATGKERATLKLVMAKNNANLVLNLAVTADGTTLATGHADGTIKLWDLGTEQDRPFPQGARSCSTGRSPRWRIAATAKRWPADSATGPSNSGT